MDILTHTISGIAVATCVASFVPHSAIRKAKVLLVGAIGGALPDIDAISLWSHFDGSFGKLFSLPAKGSVIYSSKFWYSHHAFFHSLLASITLGLLFLAVLYLVRKLFVDKGIGLQKYSKNHFIYLITFIVAYWAHLAGDLPTPASAWGGIGFFWPSTDYVGGWGKIWWWNNYDIFLLIAGATVINLLVLALAKWLKTNAKLMTAVVLSVTLSLIVIQMNTRQFDYAYTIDSSKYQEMERNSLKEQERILGPKLYKMMMSFDKKMKFYF